MKGLRFEWDPRKDRSNFRKHGVKFEDAIKVFRDPLHLSEQDEDVDGEERWRAYGVVRGVLLLMVGHTIREESSTEEVVRIITARPATAEERRHYEAENG